MADELDPRHRAAKRLRWSRQGAIDNEVWQRIASEKQQLQQQPKKEQQTDDRRNSDDT